MTQRLRCHVAVILITLFVTIAGAQSGLSFGVGLNPLDLMANANVTVPIFVTGEARMQLVRT